MRKIPSLFQRNYDGDRLVRDEVVPGCEWVLAGEGVPTRKWDGTCCMIRGGKLYKRYDAKKGKTPPPGFEPAQDYDPETGHLPGWILVGDSSEDQWHREAKVIVDWNGHYTGINGIEVSAAPDGTYELLGPKVQGNPEGFGRHYLMAHGKRSLHPVERTYAGIREFLNTMDIEGIVWHHQDGRMCKIKKKDFGFKRTREQ